jgi:hypothetical protein
MSALRRTLAVAAVLVLAACKGDSTGPVAGTLKVNLTNPNSAQDGAVILTLTVPAVPASVSAGAGLLLWGGPVTGTTTKLVLTGTLSTGTILTLQVDDVNKVGQYGVTLQQVAMLGTFQLRPPLLSGYSATVTK